MPRKRAKAGESPVYTLLAVRLGGHEVRVEANINIDAKQPQYALQINDDDPVYKYVTHLTLRGVVTYPPDRAGDLCEVAVSGDDSPSRRVSPSLKELQERDRYGSPKYRDYRGGQIPVYRKVPGLGLLERVRGEPAWSTWLNVQARLVSDMLVLLQSSRPLYLAIDERKEGRTRWVDGIGLQSTDPAEE